MSKIDYVWVKELIILILQLVQEIVFCDYLAKHCFMTFVSLNQRYYALSIEKNSTYILSFS